VRLPFSPPLAHTHPSPASADRTRAGVRHVGRQALSDQAQKLLDGVLASFVFEEDGPRYVGTDTAALAWRLGLPGNPVARGIDILTIRDGRVSVVRTLLAPETEA
jgi:hypothetical protein